jgi:hypothetical protein
MYFVLSIAAHTGPQSEITAITAADTGVRVLFGIIYDYPQMGFLTSIPGKKVVSSKASCKSKANFL